MSRRRRDLIKGLLCLVAAGIAGFACVNVLLGISINQTYFHVTHAKDVLEAILSATLGVVALAGAAWWLFRALVARRAA